MGGHIFDGYAAARQQIPSMLPMQFSNLMAWLLKGSTSQDLRLETKVLALQVMLVIFEGVTDAPF